MASPHGAGVLPPTLRKIIVTLVIGGSSFALTNILVEDADLLSSITLSVFVSGVVFVVQFLVEVDRQLETVLKDQRIHHGALHALVDRGFRGINEATELFSLTESAALQTDVIIDFVRNAATLGGDMPPLVHKLAQSEIKRVTRFLGELGKGKVIQEGEDRDWLLGLSEHASRSIDAISLPMVDAGGWRLEGGFWTTDLGMRYLTHQQESVRRGATVRRIFILDRSEPLNEDVLRHVYRLHADTQIDVRLLLASDIPITMLSLLTDFIVFDGVVTYTTTPGTNLRKDTSMISEIRLDLDPEVAKDRTKTFNALWGMARPLE
jgi:hypothetical protein